MINEDIANEVVPSHRCTVCGAMWRLWRKEESGPHASGDSWNLRSATCGKCCDMAPMGEQIVPLTMIHLSQWIAARMAVAQMEMIMHGPQSGDEVH